MTKDCNSNPLQDSIDNLRQWLSDVAAVGLLLGAACITDASIAPLPAHAASSSQQQSESVILKTALVIQTSRSSSSSTSQESILKTEIDGKALLKTIVSNRKEYSKSLDSISQSIQTELSKPAWMELTKELLSIEEDVAQDVGLPQTIQIRPPSDVIQSVKSLLKGRIQVVVDGEVIDIDVEDVKGDQPGEDEITIHVKGRRINVGLPTIVQQDEGGLAMVLPEEQLDPGSNFWDFWNADLDLSSIGVVTKDDGVRVTNGLAILSGSTVLIALSYWVSYQYYLSEIAEVEAAAEAAKAKRAAAAAAKKKAAATVVEVNTQEKGGSKKKDEEKSPAKTPKKNKKTSDNSDQKVQTPKGDSNIENKTEGGDVSVLYDKVIDATSAKDQQSETTEKSKKGYRRMIKKFFGRTK